MNELKTIIEAAFAQIQTINPQNAGSAVVDAIEHTLAQLEAGTLRVAEQSGQEWVINDWVKKAILLCFRIFDDKLIKGSSSNYYDKIPSKYSHATIDSFRAEKIRVVPPAYVRRGVYIGENTILMPSFVNAGAHIASGCLIDTWATVGSCAQVGKNVHLSGGAGIGGVLEPLQARPTIIEDDCFIGARSEIVEGVVVGAGSVISMGVYIGQSTKIYDREKDEVIYGKVPPGSVVVAGSLPTANGRCSIYAAIIVKKVDAKTRAKVGINNLLRVMD